jgi:hypothetical protein
MSKELAIKESYSPTKIKDMTAMAAVLKYHVVKHKLYTNIKNKNYAHVEGWQFAGGMMGLFPQVESVQNISTGTETKWQAKVNLVDQKTGKIVGVGFAVCSSKEANKKGFDEYAVLSMAQTRAIGKAYRNLIGWVMKLAGYEGTPSEEMRKVNETPKDPTSSETVVVPDEDLKNSKVCQNCDSIISDAEASYSQKIFKKRLCRDCQKEAKAKK